MMAKVGLAAAMLLDAPLFPFSPFYMTKESSFLCDSTFLGPKLEIIILRIS